jgi:hypothetical protein
VKRSWVVKSMTVALVALAAPAFASPAAPPAAQPPAAQAAAQVAATSSAAAPAPAPGARDPMPEARALVKRMYDVAGFIQRMQDVAGPRAVRASCVAQKLAEAKIGIRIAGDEMARLKDSVAKKDDGERDYALRRLRLLAERTQGLTHAARVCAEDERSTVDITQVEVQVDTHFPADDPSRLSFGAANAAGPSPSPR